MAQLCAIVGVSLLAYMVAAWAAGKLLGLSESDFYILFAALSAIGVIAAGVIVWWKMRQQEQAADLPSDAPLDPNNEIDALVREAEAKLAASQMGKGATIGTLPVVLVIGDQGTAKTSTILNSGWSPNSSPVSRIRIIRLLRRAPQTSGWQRTRSSRKPALRCWASSLVGFVWSGA